jgi:hypothetical protein
LEWRYGSIRKSPIVTLVVRELEGGSVSRVELMVESRRFGVLLLPHAH